MDLVVVGTFEGGHDHFLSPSPQRDRTVCSGGEAVSVGSSLCVYLPGWGSRANSSRQEDLEAAQFEPSELAAQTENSAVDHLSL